MQRVVAMGRRLQGKPLFFGRGTVIMAIEMACEMASTVTVHVSDDDRTLDILTTGPHKTDLLSGATLHLVSVLRSNYRGSRLTTHQIIRVRNDKLNDPFIQFPFNHTLLGACRVKNVTTFVKKQCRPISPSGSKPSTRTHFQIFLSGIETNFVRGLSTSLHQNAKNVAIGHSFS
eukprot:m.79241 g.79241  ORF g.79241 m.79241 type:complete len:174 (-) comp10788_c0_seq1:123-644(-)